MARNTPSSAYLRAPLELARVRHLSNTCDDRASARTLFFYYFFFLGFTLDLFLQLGVLVIIFRRRLLLVGACGGHDASKTENNS
jgi:hypothetical protein